MGDVALRERRVQLSHRHLPGLLGGDVGPGHVPLRGLATLLATPLADRQPIGQQDLVGRGPQVRAQVPAGCIPQDGPGEVLASDLATARARRIDQRFPGNRPAEGGRPESQGPGEHREVGELLLGEAVAAGAGPPGPRRDAAPAVLASPGPRVGAKGHATGLEEPQGGDQLAKRLNRAGAGVDAAAIAGVGLAHPRRRHEGRLPAGRAGALVGPGLRRDVHRVGAHDGRHLPGGQLAVLLLQLIDFLRQHVVPFFEAGYVGAKLGSSRSDTAR